MYVTVEVPPNDQGNHWRAATPSDPLSDSLFPRRSSTGKDSRRLQDCQAQLAETRAQLANVTQDLEVCRADSHNLKTQVDRFNAPLFIQVSQPAARLVARTHDL